MTGPEHYRRGEELAERVHNLPISERTERGETLLREAAVHAALAQVAATMYGHAAERHHRARVGRRVQHEQPSHSGRGRGAGGGAITPSGSIQ
jgi:hypothetical protein